MGAQILLLLLVAVDRHNLEVTSSYAKALPTTSVAYRKEQNSYVKLVRVDWLFSYNGRSNRYYVTIITR